MITATKAEFRKLVDPKIKELPAAQPGIDVCGLRGHLLEGIDPNPNQLRHARRIAFDNCTGGFYDPESGKDLESCTALFLMPGLKARYIP